MISNDISRLDAELAYAKLGFAVFPVQSKRADGSCTCNNPFRKNMRVNEMHLNFDTTKPINLLRIKTVLTRAGLPMSTLYEKVQQKLMPEPIRISKRSVAWPDFEIDEINKLLIAGGSEEEIRTLVKNLTKQRQQQPGEQS